MKKRGAKKGKAKKVFLTLRKILEKNDIQAAKKFIRELPPEDLTRKFKYGEDCPASGLSLLWRFTVADSVELVSFFLEMLSGRDRELLLLDEYPPIQAACRFRKNLEIVKLLLKYKAKEQLCSLLDNYYPIFWAIWNKDAVLLKLLMGFVPEEQLNLKLPKVNNITPLEFCIRIDWVLGVNVLRPYCTPKFLDENLMLFPAVKCDHSWYVKVLIEEGADPTIQKSKAKWLPAHFACKNRKTDTLGILLSKRRESATGS